MGWDATNPYDDGMLSNFSLQLPESSCDTVDDYVDTNPIQFNTALPSSTNVFDNRQMISQPSSVKYISMPPPSSSLLAQSVQSSSSSSRFLPLYSLKIEASTRKRLVPSGPCAPTLPVKRSELEEKRQRRLEKNREIAKNCRKRKKEKKEALEEEIRYLSEENARLRVQLKDETDDEMRRKQRMEGLKRLREKYESRDAAGLQQELRQFVADWVSFGQKRLMMAEFHLDQLKSLILPTQVGRNHQLNE